MKTTVIIWSLLLLFATTSCDPERSEHVNQDRIKTNYSVAYYSDGNRLKAIASFYFGSTPLRINHPAKIMVENKTMKVDESVLGFLDYELTLKEFQDTVVFYYTDHDERTFVNKIGIPGPIQFDNLKSNYSISNEIEIPFTGGTLANGESIILEITKNDNSGNSMTYYHDVNNSRVIKLSANYIDVSLVGNCTIWLKRHINYELQEFPFQGTMYGEYLARPKEVRLAK